MISRPVSPGDEGEGGVLGLDVAMVSYSGKLGKNSGRLMRASVAQRHVQRMRQSLATVAAPELHGAGTATPGEEADYMQHLRQSLARDDGPLAPPPPVKPDKGGSTGPTLSFVRKTTKYWVQTCDMAEVKRLVGESLPLYQFNADLDGDSQLCNSVYLDNANRDLYQQRMEKVPGALALRLRWYDVGEPDTVFVERKTHRESWCGEVSVKERFALHTDDVVPFFRGEHTADDVAAVMRQQGKGAAEIDAMRTLFSEVYEKIESMRLEPSVRTQYYRAAWQSDSSASVRISLDAGLFMITENPKSQSVSTLESGRWFRDPYATISASPHVLSVAIRIPLQIV
jgi:SPX domain protein involved in polyphosphate accumulation